MATKNTYWLADGYGSKALVEGADQRDRWLPLGWTVSGEPADGDMVWMRHAVHSGHAQFSAGVVDTWKALGWEPSPPPEPVDLLHDEHLVDVTPSAAEVDKPVADSQNTSTRTADSGAKKGN
ncbi:hypothetical protein ACFYUR_22100 [Micromonospora haikouensis]|uniref:hypothetical protein n=1 Tax=Micromonospora haikouensis TaxID=686309 RepID=UPI00367D1CDF